jgi:hypothetical protein
MAASVKAVQIGVVTASADQAALILVEPQSAP